MAITKLASQCPAPQVYSGEIVIADNAVDTNPAFLIHAKPTNAGMTVELPARMNENWVRLDLLGRHGGGCYALVNGCTLSAGTGLVANVAAGKIMLDGFVEITATTIVLTASQTNWIWLKTDGSLQALTSTSSPGTAAVLLGAAVTDGSGVTSIEMAGVVSIIGDVPWRETADAGMPTDTPPSTWRGYTKTLGGIWWWTGTSYSLVVDGMPLVPMGVDSGRTMKIPSGFQQQVFQSFDVSGTFEVSGEFRVTE